MLDIWDVQKKYFSSSVTFARKMPSESPKSTTLENIIIVQAIETNSLMDVEVLFTFSGDANFHESYTHKNDDT